MVDLVYGSDAGLFRTDSFDSVIRRLEGRGRNVQKITRDSLNPEAERIGSSKLEELDDTPLIYRRKSGFEGDRVLKDFAQLETKSLMKGMTGPNILPHWKGVQGSDNKTLGKENLRKSKVAHLPSYDAKTAKDIHEAGHPLFEKPESGSLGEGVRPILPSDNFTPRSDRIYEPLINHHDPDSPWVERRAVGLSGKYVNGVFAVKDRKLKNRKDSEDFRPMNISNGNGTYEELDPVSSPFNMEDASFVLNAISANGGGVQGVDYLYNRESGQRVVIETNSNVGFTGIRKASDADIDGYAADLLEKEIDGERFYGMTENLEKYSHENSRNDPDFDDKVESIDWIPEYLDEDPNEHGQVTPETEYSGNTAQPAA